MDQNKTDQLSLNHELLSDEEKRHLQRLQDNIKLVQMDLERAQLRVSLAESQIQIELLKLYMHHQMVPKAAE
jgi:hypothetical protein